jgi:hypothetical protein
VRRARKFASEKTHLVADDLLPKPEALEYQIRVGRRRGLDRREVPNVRVQSVQLCPVSKGIHREGRSTDLVFTPVLLEDEPLEREGAIVRLGVGLRSGLAGLGRGLGLYVGGGDSTAAREGARATARIRPITRARRRRQGSTRGRRRWRLEQGDVAEERGPEPGRRELGDRPREPPTRGRGGCGCA